MKLLFIMVSPLLLLILFSFLPRKRKPLKEYGKQCPNCGEKLYSEIANYHRVGWANQVYCLECNFHVLHEVEI